MTENQNEEAEHSFLVLLYSFQNFSSDLFKNCLVFSDFG